MNVHLCTVGIYFNAKNSQIINKINTQKNIKYILSHLIKIHVIASITAIVCINWNNIEIHAQQHETLTRCWANIGPPSTTLAQHWVKVSCLLGCYVGYTSRKSRPPRVTAILRRGCGALAEYLTASSPAQKAKWNPIWYIAKCPPACLDSMSHNMLIPHFMHLYPVRVL